VTYTALQIDRPGSWRLVDVASHDPGPGEVTLAVHAAGICGSDRELYEGGRPLDFCSYPVIPGHEWSGTVTAVSDGVDPSLVGRKAVAEGYRNCGSCPTCREGHTNLCRGGYEETGFTKPGAFAEQVTLPARLLHLLDDDADLDAAALIEPAAVAAAAILQAPPRPAQRVAVVGAGTLGLLVTRLLSAYSPAELVTIDPRADRGGLTGEFGATAALTPEETATLDGHFDLVVETAGVASTGLAAAKLLRRGGTLTLTGIPAGDGDGLPPGLIVGRQLSVHSVFGARSEAWGYAVASFNAGQLRPEPLITHRFALADYGKALDALTEPKTGKILLTPAQR
jgi:threonine dehydrogenase-like Zn-dependent dehydrogenase